MTSTLRLVLAFLLAVLAQLAGTMLLPTFPLLFDLPLLFAIRLALTGNPWAGLLGGLVAGLASDAVSGGPYGLHGFATTLVGYSLALLASRVMLRQTAAVTLIAAVAAAAKQTVLAALGASLFSPPAVPEPRWAFAQIGTTALLCLAVHVLRDRLWADEDRPPPREARIRLG